MSSSTFQKEEQECTWGKHLMYAVLLRFQIGFNLRAVFSSSPFLYSQTSEFTKNSFYPSLPSPVTCEMSCVMRHVSDVTCQVSHVTCHFFFFLGKVVNLAGGAFVINGAYPVQFCTFPLSSITCWAAFTKTTFLQDIKLVNFPSKVNFQVFLLTGFSL